MKILNSRGSDSYSKFKTQDFTFYMDSGQLFIQIGESDGYALTPQDTHRLLNLLYDYRQDIIDANTAAQEYGRAHYKRRRMYRDDTL